MNEHIPMNLRNNEYNEYIISVYILIYTKWTQSVEVKKSVDTKMNIN